MKSKRIIIFGGDGFCGWPTALYLSNCGAEVLIVDNLSRRRIDEELELKSLTPIAPIETRLQAWKKVSGQTIQFVKLDMSTEYSGLADLLTDFRPTTVVHFAQQRAAPYSMKSSEHKRYTVTNNVSTTHNLLAALVETHVDAHVVHLGTMGVYGYDAQGLALPEGYLPVLVEGEDGTHYRQEILHPTNPGSIYHMTKTLDQLMLAFYNKNDGIRMTDLHQGIVWGTQTAETSQDLHLINRFDYDGDYGTVLNRFLVQAAVGHCLTVHGSGGQTRAFIHIRDTVRCIELAIRNPPKRDERVKILNQMTETCRVADLARLVHSNTGAKIEYVVNPRQEAAENDLAVENRQLLDLGLDPITLSDGLMDEVIEIARWYVDRVDPSKIPCTSYWTRERRHEAEVKQHNSPASPARKVHRT
jgi:UDP-sulfoquinovose synthase